MYLTVRRVLRSNWRFWRWLGSWRQRQSLLFAAILLIILNPCKSFYVIQAYSRNDRIQYYNLITAFFFLLSHCKYQSFTTIPFLRKRTLLAWRKELFQDAGQKFTPPWSTTTRIQKKGSNSLTLLGRPMNAEIPEQTFTHHWRHLTQPGLPFDS